jgi:hypothetical protein
VLRVVPGAPGPELDSVLSAPPHVVGEDAGKENSPPLVEPPTDANQDDGPGAS